MSGIEKTDRLLATVESQKSRLQKYKGRVLGEQNTKASLIEPLLESLGWDTRDFEEVHREFKAKRADRPVDYALQLRMKPMVFIEAKGLGENLSDRKWVSQILGYATVAGVIWCVLTDGDEYRFYNASAPVDADEKLFCQIRISEGQHEQLVATLNLISRASIESGELNGYWNAQFADRHVQRALQQVLGGPERSLVRILKRHLPDFTDKQVLDSLKRLSIAINGQLLTSTAPLESGRSSHSINQSKSKPTRLAQAKRRSVVGVSLQQLLQAGLLVAPLPVFRKYKGKTIQATVQVDGTVEFAGKSYASCSSAAEHARSTVTGRKMNTNGWAFWQYTDSENKKRDLHHARQLFISGSQKR